MSYSIDIQFNSAYGSRGTADTQFDYPSGIDFRDGYFYISDRQNQRIVVYDSNFNFSSKFGTYGTGALELNFPEGLQLYEDTDCYVANSANHRITKFSHITTQWDFGSLGSGNNQFNYPTDIAMKYPYIYVADKLNHAIKVYSIALGMPVFMFDITGLNFPEGVEIFADKIAVANSANDEVLFYDLAGGYLNSISDSNWTYVTGLYNINDEILVIIDKQGSKLYFYDLDHNLITTYSTGLSFPESVVFVNDKLYITDSANHRVVVLDLFITENVPAFAEAIERLTKQLYPTGRAWWLKVGGVFEKLHKGLSYSEGRAYENDLSVLDAILPDNDNYTEQDASNHEQAYGLVSNSSVSLADRKKAIIRKLQYPGNIKARQDYRYIQAQLQEAGFDVYVHENRSGVLNALYGSFNYNQLTYGQIGISWSYSILANYIDESRDASFNIGASEYQNFLFIVGGSTVGTSANVDINRKKEFRELLLKLKPANMVGLLNINYV